MLTHSKTCACHQCEQLMFHCWWCDETYPWHGDYICECMKAIGREIRDKARKACANRTLWEQQQLASGVASTAGVEETGRRGSKKSAPTESGQGKLF